MTTRTSATEIAERLRDRIEDLAEYLVGDKPIARTRSALRFYPRGGLVIEIAGSRRGLWCDHGSGSGGDGLDLVRHLRKCGTIDAIKWASDWLGGTSNGVHEERRTPLPEPAKADTASTARRLWQEAGEARSTPVETYLASRGLTLRHDVPIRFHPACPRGSERLPAMVCLMTDPTTAEPCGVHRTYLRPDGCGKVEHGTAKQMLGNAGVIRLVEDAEVTTGLGIAEGIETSLAIMQRAGWSPIWACASAGGIARLPVLAGIEALTIFPDLDDKGAGIDAARKCAERYREGSREVTIMKPPIGRDWLDALNKQEGRDGRAYA